MSLLKLVESFEKELVHSNASVRTSAIESVTKYLKSRPSSQWVSSIHVLVEFLCMRLDDEACLLAISSSLLFIVENNHCSLMDMDLILKNISERLKINEQTQPVRHNFYKIFLEAIDSFTRKLDSHITKVFVASFEGEKDPRNLILHFQLISKLAQYDLIPKDLAEEVFNLVFCYFPITFSPPPNDPYGIKTEDLKYGLKAALKSLTFLAFNQIIPSLMEKLPISTISTAKDVFDILIEVIPIYDNEFIKNDPIVFAKDILDEIGTERALDLVSLGVQVYKEFIVKLISPSHSTVNDSKSSFVIDSPLLDCVDAPIMKLMETLQNKRKSSKGLNSLLMVMININENIAKYILDQYIPFLIKNMMSDTHNLNMNFVENFQMIMKELNQMKDYWDANRKFIEPLYFQFLHKLSDENNDNITLFTILDCLSLMSAIVPIDEQQLSEVFGTLCHLTFKHYLDLQLPDKIVSFSHDLVVHYVDYFEERLMPRFNLNFTSFEDPRKYNIWYKVFLSLLSSANNDHIKHIIYFNVFKEFENYLNACSQNKNSRLIFEFVSKIVRLMHEGNTQDLPDVALLLSNFDHYSQKYFVNHTEEDLNILNEFCHIISSLFSFLPLEKQRLCLLDVEKSVANINLNEPLSTYSLTKLKVYNTLVYSLKPDIDFNEFMDFSNNIIFKSTRLLLSPDFMISDTYIHLSSIMNKFKYPYCLEKFKDDIICLPNNDFINFIWATKAMTMKCHSESYVLLVKCIKLYILQHELWPPCVFEVMLNHKDFSFPYAQVKPFSKQKLIDYLRNHLEDFYNLSESKLKFYLLITALIKSTKFSILIDYIEAYFYWILVSFLNIPENQVSSLNHLIDFMASLIKEKTPIILPELQSIIHRLLFLSNYQNVPNMAVREQAIHCIRGFIYVFPMSTLLSYKELIVKTLSLYLDDPKRIIREALTKTLNEWILL